MPKTDPLQEIRKNTEKKQKEHLSWMIKSAEGYAKILKSYRRQKGLVGAGSLLSSLRQHNSALMEDAERYLNESLIESVDISQMYREKNETIEVVRLMNDVSKKNVLPNNGKVKRLKPVYKRSMLCPYPA